METPLWWVYVLHSVQGPYYVGSTTDPRRRLRQHNGEIKGGGKYTATKRPWTPAALHGPYKNRSEAFKAEYALKHGKRGINRTKWSLEDSEWCVGLGPDDPWVLGK
jgi:putative endonuclease